MEHRIITLTFGHVPDLDDEWRNRAEGFTWDLRGTDAETAERCLTGYCGDTSPDALHQHVTDLAGAWQDSDDDAGSLASAVLGCLGYEWV